MTVSPSVDEVISVVTNLQRLEESFRIVPNDHPSVLHADEVMHRDMIDAVREAIDLIGRLRIMDPHLDEPARA